jgi:hypothetical protein
VSNSAKEWKKKRCNIWDLSRRLIVLINEKDTTFPMTILNKVHLTFPKRHLTSSGSDALSIFSTSEKMAQ